MEQVRAAIAVRRAEPHRADTRSGARSNLPRQFAFLAPSDGGPDAVQFRRRRQIVNVPVQSLRWSRMSRYTCGQSARAKGAADVDIPTGLKLECAQSSDLKPLRARQSEQQNVCARLRRSRHGRTTRDHVSESWSCRPSSGGLPSPPASDRISWRVRASRCLSLVSSAPRPMTEVDKISGNFVNNFKFVAGPSPVLPLPHRGTPRASLFPTSPGTQT
jgi:hypothetical protein